MKVNSQALAEKLDSLRNWLDNETTLIYVRDSSGATTVLVACLAATPSNEPKQINVFDITIQVSKALGLRLISQQQLIADSNRQAIHETITKLFPEFKLGSSFI